jgi:hypothetical protein
MKPSTKKLFFRLSLIFPLYLIFAIIATSDIFDIRRSSFGRFFQKLNYTFFGDGPSITSTIFFGLVAISVLYLIFYFLDTKYHVFSPSNTRNSIRETSKKNENTPLPWIAAGVAAIAVFLPWVEVSSSVAFGSYQSSYSSGGISGIQIPGGIVGLLLTLLGGYMAFKKMKWSFVTGAINLFNGVGYLLGWFGTRGSFSSSFGSGSASMGVDAKFGLYLFILASLAFVVLTFRYTKETPYSSTQPN